MVLSPNIVSKLEALQKAKELDLDVVEIAPNAKPPVAKLIDVKKFKYQEQKKERESKKTQKNVGVKEIRLRPFIGTHDFDTRVAQAKDFLKDGNQVKINVFFRGREITRKEFGYNIIKRFIASLESVKVVKEPHMEGKALVTMLVPDTWKAKLSSPCSYRRKNNFANARIFNFQLSISNNPAFGGTEFKTL
ncbi:MAG: Translation initiation factor IF-3 [Candidatus Gottesmanbacteria bacterium GW2011_GWB1_44_11c]|uniref:Translation initiation factor IF-3 n=1 Tax=Candidatus Gottesmanbacteria bacterium GW2011_GWB1_44_11c TaxID=1618447 RepID=A0A0G1GVB8_9BACT|nr:MAG: Translation initiation factor IF-3 [Candidatus Gottesmanbacteria bacterium GW2011_GWB1_44_11c]